MRSRAADRSLRQYRRQSEPIGDQGTSGMMMRRVGPGRCAQDGPAVLVTTEAPAPIHNPELGGARTHVVDDAKVVTIRRRVPGYELNGNDARVASVGSPLHVRGQEKAADQVRSVGFGLADASGPRGDDNARVVQPGVEPHGGEDHRELPESFEGTENLPELFARGRRFAAVGLQHRGDGTGLQVGVSGRGTGLRRGDRRWHALRPR